MKKINLKFIITLFLVLLILFSTFCFATETNNDVMLISNDTEQNIDNNQTRYSDLYISGENQYDIKNIIDGNVFASVETLNIDSSNDGGIITGNLYATANTVTIKSNVKYSETEKDDFGNYKLESAINFSKIDGNVFVIADKFVLEPACQINGDLYVCATNIELSQNAIINGNVFVVADTLNLNSKIDNASLYATVKTFNMDYYGFIRKDLYLSSESANIAGYIYRNSFITSNNLTTTSTFINKENFKVNNCSNMIFSGEIIGNADINSENITFKNQDDDGKSFTCRISGNLNYSSNNEIQIGDKIVFGDINYNKYIYPNSFLSSFGEYLLKLITSLVYIFIIYLIISKFTPNYIDKLSNVNLSKILVYIGFGFGFFILVPIISILLFITRVGTLLGVLLMFLYIIILLLAKPIFVISVSSLLKEKFKLSINNIICIIALTVLISLIELIPYLGFVISIFIMIIGSGLLVKSLVVKK